METHPSPAAHSLPAPQPPELEGGASHPITQRLTPLLASPPAQEAWLCESAGGQVALGSLFATRLGWCRESGNFQARGRGKDMHFLALGTRTLLLQKTRLKDPAGVCRTHETMTNLKKTKS